MASSQFTDKQKVNAIRIIKKLFSAKSRKNNNEETAEARVDYISDHLGIVKEEVIKIITLLREEKILADAKDLTAFIKDNDTINHSLSLVKFYAKIENLLLPIIENEEKIINLKELGNNALKLGFATVTPKNIKTILNFWAIKNWVKRRTLDYSRNHIAVKCIQPKETLKARIERRNTLSEFVINYLFKKTKHFKKENNKPDDNEILVEFSVHELKDNYAKEQILFKQQASVEDIEDTLFYLSRIEAIKIEGGFLVIYNKLTIDRLEKNNQIQYKKEDYQQLDQFYQNRMQQIHIVGEYAKKMLEDYTDALKFVEDYFQLNYNSFLKKYFPGSRGIEIRRNITPKKFKQLFDSLSPRQLKIINDSQTQHIVVAAGPGSGKTRLLVHKLASLLLMEDVKHEQLLMLTFSRAAATEFKKRLLHLIGNAANFIEIKTFHSYCFDLLGRVGSIEESDEILRITTEKIRASEVEANRITKSVLVIDEAQDMDADEFALIKIIMAENETMRVIAVGDDDQNIYTFRGANSKHFEMFTNEKNAHKYELTENYRSRKNLVEFTNKFVEKIYHRFKSTPIVPVQKENGLIRVIHHNNNLLIVPLVNDIITADLAGTTGVLTKTNDEALQLYGWLVKNGIPAKLIQSNNGFDLSHLVEIRSFIDYLNPKNISPIISNEVWKNAKRKFAKKFANSSNYSLCKNLLIDFQETNPKVKYRSDFEIFI